MDTFSKEKKEMLKEVRAMEKKELHIGLGYKFKRVHGDGRCVKVVSYDDDHVEIDDGNGTHYVMRTQFNTDNFRKGA